MSHVSTQPISGARNAQYRRAAGSVRDSFVRFVILTVGFALVMSAFGIWMVGTSTGAPALSLMKLGVSLFMLVFGMSLITVAKSGDPSTTP